MKSLHMVLRFAVVGGLVLLLLVPLMMIRGVVTERSLFRDEAFQRVAESRAGSQQLVGPVRVVPWIERREVEVVDKTGRQSTETVVTHGHRLQMPRRMVVDGRLLPDQRQIGIFKVPVYSWMGSIRVGFSADAAPPPRPGRTYGQPYIAFGVSDVRGLVGSPVLKQDGRALRLLPGVPNAEALGPGLHALQPETGGVADGALQATTLELSLQLDGSRAFSVVPLADDNQIALRSRWPHPSFAGAFLPNQRRVDDQGFEARWSVSSLASNAQQQLVAGEAGLQAVQVSLVDPVDVYTQVDRASKYGVLFVVLTFVGFILFELVRRLRIHPLQYLMVGLALAVFFLLLLSLSEHIAFWQAYVVSAVACIGLQAMYLAHVLGHWRRGLGFAAMLTGLYGALFGLLVSENNALLMGSLLLFAILAVAMWVTRRVDWYALGSVAPDAGEERPGEPPQLPGRPPG